MSPPAAKIIIEMGARCSFAAELVGQYQVWGVEAHPSEAKERMMSRLKACAKSE